MFYEYLEEEHLEGVAVFEVGLGPKPTKLLV